MRILPKRRVRHGILSALTAGCLFQFGSCNISQVTVPTTLDGRELLITLVRGAILSPIDQAITAAIQNAFADDEE